MLFKIRFIWYFTFLFLLNGCFSNANIIEAAFYQDGYTGHQVLILTTTSSDSSTIINGYKSLKPDSSKHHPLVFFFKNGTNIMSFDQSTSFDDNVKRLYLRHPLAIFSTDSILQMNPNH